jgi:two-component system, cell cycle sensor histidine kinase and response regulator CckA
VNTDLAFIVAAAWAVMLGGALVLCVALTKRLQRAKEEVDTLRESLEERVAGRTQELSAALADARDSERAALQREQRFRNAVQDLTEQRAAADRLRETERLDAVGRLAGGVAHSFNNVLTVINTVSELMLLELDDPGALREDVKQIQVVGDRAAGLTRQLLSFSRRQTLHPRTIDLNEAIGEMGTLLRRLLGADTTLGLSLASGLLQVKADPSQLGQLITNLALNARDAMPRGGRLLIETEEVWLDDGEAARYGVPAGTAVRIAVTDTGVGMEADTLSRVFEPFFTTKGPGQGTGLGLASAYGFVKQSGGGIRVKSEVGRGTTFLIVLPAAQALAVESPRQRRVASGEQHILLVDDDRAVRSVTGLILARRGYRITECESPLDALNIVKRSPDQFHAVVTDVIMPGMSGPQLAGYIAHHAPDLPVLFISGYPKEELVNHGIDEASERFLHKPMTADQLVAAVRQLLDGQEKGTAAA